MTLPSNDVVEEGMGWGAISGEPGRREGGGAVEDDWVRGWWSRAPEAGREGEVRVSVQVGCSADCRIRDCVAGKGSPCRLHIQLWSLKIRGPSPALIHSGSVGENILFLFLKTHRRFWDTARNFRVRHRFESQAQQTETATQ